MMQQMTNSMPVRHAFCAALFCRNKTRRVFVELSGSAGNGGRKRLPAILSPVP